MTTATKAIVVTGILTRVDIRDDREIDYNYTHRYSPNSEHRVKFLDCAMTTDDGRTVYFQTPRMSYRVTCVPGAAIVTFDESPWFREVGEKAVATPGEPADKTVVATIGVDDRITIKGSIKAEKTSRSGKPYIVLNRVKRAS